MSNILPAILEGWGSGQGWDKATRIFARPYLNCFSRYGLAGRMFWASCL